MNAATEFDLGPLTWVKGEIEQALGRAESALDLFASNGEASQLKFCRTHLHQAHGALDIVGLDGVTELTESLEALLQSVDENRLPAEGELFAAVKASLDALRQYLDDLMAGEPHQPLRLFKVYERLAELRGLPPVHPGDLFYPDLSLRPPRSNNAVPVPSDPDEIQAALRAQRLAFQKGLLLWLKMPGRADEGRQAMSAALAAIEALQPTPAARSFWWVSQAFIEALGEPDLAAEGEARQLCSKIDTQIRRLLDGAGLAERVMREALYYVARAPADLHPQVAQAQSVFALPGLLPANTSATSVMQPGHDAVLRRLRDRLEEAEEIWNRFCAGSPASLGGFADEARTCAELTAQLGQTDLKRLGQALAAVGNWLQEDPSRFADSVAMEVATAILLLQNAQENFSRLGSDFARQVDLMVDRLYGCIAGRPASGEDIPLLDEMTRRAQERLLIGQVGREIQNSLAQVEQALDAFFRDNSKRDGLAQLAAPFRQVAGALTMLGHMDAVAALKNCTARVEQFADLTYSPVDADFQEVADGLSLIGFFVDALQHGEIDYAGFVARMRGEKLVEEESDTLAASSVEHALIEQARETQALAEALRESPDDQELHEELKHTLESIQKDADLVADHSLGESAKAALAALESGENVNAALSSLTGETPQPSAETLELAGASHEALDAELLAIFIEEAHEVLGTMAEQKAALHASPHDVEALTTIRRSTHTLKGSGRMVGLSDLGEVAWAIEQTLNQWLRQDIGVSPELMQLIDTTHGLFTEWVAFLEGQKGVQPDARPVVALAERLRGVAPEEDAAPVPAAVVVPAVVPEDAPAPPPAPEIEEVPAIAPALEVLAPPEVLPEPEASLPEVSATPAVPDTEPVAEEFAVAEELDIDALQLQVAADVLGDFLVEEDDLGPDVTALAGSPVEPEAPAPADPWAAIEPAATALTLYDIFREEARGHLQVLQTHCAALLSDPAIPTAFDMQRAAHTLGGIAGTVGLMPLNHLAISLEHALLRRDGSGHAASIASLDVIQRSIAGLESMFAGLAAQQPPEEASELVAELEALYPAPHAHETNVAPPLAQQPEPVAEPVIEPASLVVDQLEPEAALPTLTDEIDEQLLPIFLEEAADQVRALTENLRSWRLAPGDSVAPQAIARLLHTFKGNARMAGAMNLGEATHLLETRVQDAVRGGSASVALIDEIEAGCDALAVAVDRLRAGPQEAPVAPVSTEAAEVASAAVTEFEPEIDVGGQRSTLRVRADLIDRLVNEAGELSIARARIEGEMRSLKGSLLDLTENVIRLRRQLREIEIQAETQMQTGVAQASDGQAAFDPLELDRFTRFQELTRFMAESVNDVATVQQNLLKNLDDANAAILAQSRLNRSLQQELMGVRMLPFASQAERLYRIVRQTAKDVGKRANLDIVGGQVEIDRSVLDKMMAPVEHMLRNAVTHGIETREQRVAVDKPEIGEITLHLAQEANELILTLSDDGRGLALDRIRKRALEMGLLKAGQEIADAALLDFIFQPGFSTASELTQVSGRGVGMDVVKTEIAALGGRVEIQSQAGVGTRFRLYVPLTLAVTQTLLIRAGAHLYAVPSTMIEQVLELKEKPLSEIRDQGAAQWQGNTYPFHFLPHLLGEHDALPEAHRQFWVLLLRSGSQRAAVLVDELKGNQEVVVKNIGAQLARVPGVAGATVLGDGRIVLILNPVALTARAGQVISYSGEAAVAPLPLPELLLPTVMVVDDSLTVRKITSRLLQREGYQVILAKDGVDALEHLVDEMPDVILSDIEMPRMDGFDLVRNIRADDRLRDIPVVMITSRTADKHRNYALEIGANHYLGKPYDEDHLLGLIAAYCKKTA